MPGEQLMIPARIASATVACSNAGAISRDVLETLTVPPFLARGLRDHKPGTLSDVRPCRRRHPEQPDRAAVTPYVPIAISSAADEVAPPCEAARTAGSSGPDVGSRGHHGVVWPGSSEELVAVQSALAAASPAPWHAGADAPAIGGCVVCFARGQTGPGARGDRAWAAAAVVRGRQVLAHAELTGEARAGYVPGLLALREGACLEAAVRSLDWRPDVLLVDATGRDHPRGAGLAMQLGAVLDLPTVGVTHRPLLAAGAWPADVRGATAPLLLDGARVGAWLRTRTGARPLAIHAAWRTDVETAVEAVSMATFEHRTPEPFRHARMLARTARARG